MEMNKMEIITTGEKWVGYGINTIHSSIIQILGNAQSSIILAIFVLTDRNVVDKIIEALERGVKVEIYTYIIENLRHTENVDLLINLKKKYPYLSVFEIDEVLHTKILIIDERYMVVTSANFSYGGLIKNYELGFKIDDIEIAQKIISLLRRLREL